MSRYIDADALLSKYGEKHFNGEITSEEYYAIKIPLDYAPTADVAPVVHGEWIDKRIGIGTCSRCNYRTTRYNYCPCCGAKMDK